MSLILAGVQVKHGIPLAPSPIEQEARDGVSHALADGLVVSGTATGEPTPISDLKRVRSAEPDVPSSSAGAPPRRPPLNCSGSPTGLSSAPP